MDNNYTDITLVVDKSSSMQSCWKEAEDGLNAFIKEQQNKEGRATLTLVEFSGDSTTLCCGVDIKDAPNYRLRPNGWTALYDAMGRAIQMTGNRLAVMPEEQRPGLVLFVVVTDGEENQSRAFTAAKIREMVELQQNVYKWQFLYLGANVNLDKLHEEVQIKTSGMANYNVRNTAQAYGMAASKVGLMRAAAARGDDAAVAANATWTDQEREDLMK